MKRTSLFVSAGIVAAILVATIASAQEYSKPVLVGGDQSNATPVERQASEAISLKFFSHPKAAASVNFADDTGKIQLPNVQDMFIGDIVGTPGFTFNGDVQTIHADSEMLDHPGERIQQTIHPLNGLGPDDLRLIFNGIDITLGLDLQVGDQDQRSHRLVMADVRNEIAAPDETMDLFGMQDALEAGLIGNAHEVTPYTPQLYPASIIYDPINHPFKWCVAPNFKLPWSGYGDNCPALPNYPAGTLSDNQYGEVFLYDVADVGNGFISASYDPLLVNTNSALYAKVILPGPLTVELGQPYSTGLKYAYYSPLALFRKVTEAGSARYRFSGYTSWDMPVYDGDLTDPEKQFIPGWKLWPFIFTNWILPVTNPVAVEAVDAGGASSWQHQSDPQQALSQMIADGHPDTDLAVAYQTTLFSLDKEVPDIFGRPAVFGDGKYHTLAELMVTGCTSGTQCPQETPLTAAVFPDRVLSLLLLWKQEHQWQQGGPNGQYVDMNPSHVFEPDAEFAAIIGPGVYDTAVVTDFAGDAAKRREHVMVPSALLGPGNQALIYDVNRDNPQIWFKAMYSDLINNPGAVVCKDVTQYKATPFHRPDLVSIERPVGQHSSVFVPYQIRAGDLDGDACEDFIVTWRGMTTIADPNNPKYVKFDDGNGMMFSNRVSIVLRSDQGGKCLPTPAANYPAGIPPYIEIPVTAGMTQPPQVASAAIGDFDGDFKNDIAAGNQISEDFNGETTAVAYVFKQASNFSTIACGTNINDTCERIRVGVKAGAGTPGVAMITADHTKSIGIDAIAQVNGLPLMLPEIDCPDNSSQSPTPVGSVFETYVSLFTNFMANWAYNNAALKDVFEHKLPFVDDPNAASPRPMPERCVTQNLCGSQTYGSKTSFVPLLATDPCCGCDTYGTGTMEWQSKCGKYLQAYGKKFSCPLYEYAMVACKPQLKELELPSIDQQNRGLARVEEGSNAASGWNADMVVSEDRHVIADVSEIEDAGWPSMPSIPGWSPLDLSGLTTPELALREDLAKWIENVFTGDPGSAQQAADAIRNAQGMKDTENLLNMMISGAGLVGPPLSAEELFLKPMAGAYRSSTDMKVKQQPVAGCSLIASVNLPGGTRLVGPGDCGNNHFDPINEQCDFENGVLKTNCLPPVSCYDCKCITCNPANPTPQCNPALPPGQQGCANATDTCGADCKCAAVGPPPIPPAPVMDYKVKLPKGIVPQPREMTTVLRELKSPPSLCNPPNGLKDAGEECDLWGIQPDFDSHGVAQNQQYIDRLAVDCPVKNVNSVDTKADVCDINCICHYPGEGPGDNIPGGTLPKADNACVVKCLKFSSDDIKAMYDKYNTDARQWINDALPAGQTYEGDFYCEPEMPFIALCRVAAGSAPNIAAANLSLSLSYSGEPVDAQNELPYAWIQLTGSQPIDMSTLTYTEFTPVTSPIMLIPLQPSAGAQTVKSMIVPDISAGVAPLANANVTIGSSGEWMVNNMYQLRTYSAMPGQTVTLQGSGGPSAQVVEPLTPMPDGTAITIQELTYTLSPLCGPYTAVEGFRADICKNIEDQQRDAEQVKVSVQDGLRSGLSVGEAGKNAVFEPNALYVLRLDHGVYAAKGETPAVKSMYVVNAAGGPSMWGAGSGCCKTSLVSGSESLPAAALPWLLGVAVPTLLISLRRRKK